MFSVSLLHIKEYLNNYFLITFFGYLNNIYYIEGKLIRAMVCVIKPQTTHMLLNNFVTLKNK